MLWFFTVSWGVAIVAGEATRALFCWSSRDCWPRAEEATVVDRR
jgi:hypothetical protein